MGNNEHGHAFVGQPSHDPEHFSRKLRIQSGGRFIEINDLRIGCQSSCNRHTLLLSAGELIRIVIHPLQHADLLERRTSDFLCLCLFHFPCDNQTLRHILKGGLIQKKVVILEHKGSFTPDFRDFLFGNLRKVIGFSIQRKASAVCLFQKVDAAKERCFSAARGAKDCDDLSFADRHIDSVQNLCLPVK